MSLKKIRHVTNELALFYNVANGHHSLRTLKFFAMNSILHGFSAKELLQFPTYFSVQVDIDKHIHLYPDYLQYINHSCHPNVFFNTQYNQIIALKDIAENEEVTFFYPATEWQMAQVFDCFCGHNNCLGAISGAANLSKAQLQRYKVNPHILALSESI